MTTQINTPDPAELASAYKAGPGPQGSDFDFFIGEWDAKVIRYTPDGKVLKRHETRWSAQSLFGGRMIEDRFVQSVDGEDTGAVITLSTYCVETAQWEMVFLWAQQPIPNMTNFVGNRVGDEMHLTGQHHGPDGQTALSRIRFFDITSDSFLWQHSASFDGGENWHVHTSISAQRRPSA